MKKQPRILIFTVTSWNSKVGANTWETLLEGYPSEKLANICIRDEQPDSNVCARYFRISENRIIKSIINPSMKTGVEVTQKEQLNDRDLIEHNQRYQFMRKHRRFSMLMLRELVWKLRKWKTKELNEFLDDFKPDIILHSMEGYIHLNRIIQYTIQRTRAKVIGYFWDDNFTYKQSNKIGHKVYRYFQRKSLNDLVRNTDGFFAISAMTKEEADCFWGIRSVVLTKPFYHHSDEITEEMGNPISMIYTGNLLIGRAHSLKRLVEVVKKEFNSKFKIEVYTNMALVDELKNLSDNRICTIHLPVSQNEVLKLQRRADVVLFLEDIDGADALVPRLSFSTKITDYLSSGKCILAIGNKDTAPMQYFRENQSALIASSDEEIKMCLEKLLNSEEEIKEITKNAATCAKKWHDPEKVKDTFWKEIYRVYNGKIGAL